MYDTERYANEVLRNLQRILATTALLWGLALRDRTTLPAPVSVPKKLKLRERAHTHRPSHHHGLQR